MPVAVEAANETSGPASPVWVVQAAAATAARAQTDRQAPMGLVVEVEAEAAPVTAAKAATA
jgi:hypothetical protein